MQTSHVGATRLVDEHDGHSANATGPRTAWYFAARGVEGRTQYEWFLGDVKTGMVCRVNTDRWNNWCEIAVFMYIRENSLSFEKYNIDNKKKKKYMFANG